jgi:hypothetical protein
MAQGVLTGQQEAQGQEGHQLWRCQAYQVGEALPGVCHTEVRTEVLLPKAHLP